MNYDALIQARPRAKSTSHSCVITSRVRLARNLNNQPFPGWSSEGERSDIFHIISDAFSSLSFSKTAFHDELKDYSSLQKQVLVEQHLMSRELAARSVGCGLLVSKNKSLSIMINEEDHFRLQGIHPGLSLKKAYRALDKVDTQISEKLNLAFDEELGFLTSCPTNVGTGMRASVMLHLPALVLTEQIEPVLRAVSKLGLAIRGFYGEGTESLGHLYQISNQSTLGESEQEIITRIERMVKQIISVEENARLKTVEDQPHLFIDKISRAYGILKHSVIMSSKEGLTQLSLLRLGTEIGYFPEDAIELCDRLVIEIQPAHLQQLAGKKLDPEERDLARAKLLIKSLSKLRAPKL